MTVNSIGASLQTLYMAAFIFYSPEKVGPPPDLLCVSLVLSHSPLTALLCSCSAAPSLRSSWRS